MNREILFFVIINILLLFVIYQLTPIGGYIGGFFGGFFGTTGIVSFIFSLIIIEFIIGWLPYKLFKKIK
jgi:hypothetical protein